MVRPLLRNPSRCITLRMCSVAPCHCDVPMLYLDHQPQLSCRYEGARRPLRKEYLWLVEYEYNFGHSPEVSGLKKLQAYGADVGMSSYVELLSWPDRSD